MASRRASLPESYPQLFHACWHCHTVGLKPGILATKHGDYGMRDFYKDEKELSLNQAGLCPQCVEQIERHAKREHGDA